MHFRVLTFGLSFSGPAFSGISGISIKLFFQTAISMSLISNRNSFGVLFNKIASGYFVFEKKILIF